MAQRDAHCANCGNDFEYDASEWPEGLEPDHCPVCRDPETVYNWLVEEENNATGFRREAQKRFIRGEDPVSVMLESTGWNGAKEAKQKAESGSELGKRRLDTIRANLIAGVAPFKDPRSNPRL